MSRHTVTGLSATLIPKIVTGIAVDKLLKRLDLKNEGKIMKGRKNANTVGKIPTLNDYMPVPPAERYSDQPNPRLAA